MTGSVGHDSVQAESPASHWRWIWILAACATLGAVVFFLAISEDAIDVSEAKSSPSLQLVSIEIRSVGDEKAEVRAFAEVRPRWSAELRAAVSGRVVEVTNNSMVGERVEADTALVKIEDSPYVAELRAAELSVKQAQLALRQAENANMLARRDFQRNKASPPNDLALRLPQLEIARSAVTSAQARLAAARQQLQDTTLTAPFSGFVTERFVSPGQTVNVGDPILHLADDRTFELTVELGRTDWELLQKPLSGTTAKVVNRDGNIIAEATVRQAGGFLDERTRQFKVFLEVNKKAPRRILSGDFVQLVLPGITINGALNVPASALTQEGHVWYVDADDRLQRIEPRVLFRRDDRIVIEVAGEANAWRIATTPLVSFLPGQPVQARETGG